jgi:hypothetical protein
MEEIAKQMQEHDWEEAYDSDTMEEIAKQMQEHDWEEAYDSDTMDDEKLTNLLVCAVRRIHIDD